MENLSLSYNMLNKRIHINHVFSCSVEFLGSVVYDAKDTGLIHQYPCWAYSYIEGNPGTFYFSGGRVEVAAASGIFIPPNTRHYLKCHGPNKMSLVYMGISGIDFPAFKDIYSFYQSNKDISCVQVFNGAISKCITALKAGNSPAVLNSYAPLFLEKAINIHNYINLGGHMNQRNFSSDKNIITSACAILCEDYSKNITLYDLAARLYLSPRSLSKIFIQTLHMRFKEYYLMLKMEYALHILCTSDIRISQAAEMLGFCDVQYFSKKFKQYFNEAPYTVQKKFKDKQQVKP